MWDFSECVIVIVIVAIEIVFQLVHRSCSSPCPRWRHTCQQQWPRKPPSVGLRCGRRMSHFSLARNLSQLICCRDTTTARCKKALKTKCAKVFSCTGGVICRGKNRFPDPGHNLTSPETLAERAIAKEGDYPALRKLVQNQSGLLLIQCAFRMKSYL